ncbi:uncharacterized protein DFE_2267 [Desulfovibrio ferrophilus]|uniref:Uncharacterized protein n=1 Tax=Desulfovibrio ferrophilus TaxID=241368 RepID=A0A2Z6B0J8_9BACT|nr:uncharacterized protein DFE_2267 [Desulfovibrio ferrophilus]
MLKSHPLQGLELLIRLDLELGFSEWILSLFELKTDKQPDHELLHMDGIFRLCHNEYRTAQPTDRGPKTGFLC